LFGLTKEYLEKMRRSGSRGGSRGGSRSPGRGMRGGSRSPGRGMRGGSRSPGRRGRSPYRRSRSRSGGRRLVGTPLRSSGYSSAYNYGYRYPYWRDVSYYYPSSYYGTYYPSNYYGIDNWYPASVEVSTAGSGQPGALLVGDQCLDVTSDNPLVQGNTFIAGQSCDALRAQQGGEQQAQATPQAAPQITVVQPDESGVSWPLIIGLIFIGVLLLILLARK